MPDPTQIQQQLGEAVLEEILVRAGLDQPQPSPGDAVPVSLQFIVRADPETGALVISGERVNQPPLELRVRLTESANAAQANTDG